MRQDEVLYEQVQKGFKEAFAELYERYERPLFGFILRRTGNRQDAEEIFHDAMLAILKPQNLTFCSGGFAAWLYKVALNLCLNKGRAKERLRMVKAQLIATEIGPFPMTDREGELEFMEAAAQTLSPALSQVYQLRRDGKSYEETAAILGLPVGSVKSRVHNMVNHLRKELQKWLVD